MEGRETKQVGGNKSGDQQSSSRYIASAPGPSASDADHMFAGPWGVSHDDKERLQWSSVQPDPVLAGH